jgi:preprotein translocase subunit SecY
MTIWRNLANALVVPEIRNRILFVFGAFAIFVLMVHVQIPYVDIAKWQTILNQGQFLNFLGFLSGGALQRFSVLAMGITPYINASIIMQLFTVVFPEIKELMQHGGEEGRKKVGLWTRWLTVALAILQATTMAIALNKAGVFLRTDLPYLIMVVVNATAGTVWLARNRRTPTMASPASRSSSSSASSCAIPPISARRWRWAKRARCPSWAWPSSS